jgi:hypothetical protein
MRSAIVIALAFAACANTGRGGNNVDGGNGSMLVTSRRPRR